MARCQARSWRYSVSLSALVDDPHQEAGQGDYFDGLDGISPYLTMPRRITETTERAGEEVGQRLSLAYKRFSVSKRPRFLMKCCPHESIAILSRRVAGCRPHSDLNLPESVEDGRIVPSPKKLRPYSVSDQRMQPRARQEISPPKGFDVNVALETPPTPCDELPLTARLPRLRGQ
jgi:hypothetical protein